MIAVEPHLLGRINTKIPSLNFSLTQIQSSLSCCGTKSVVLLHVVGPDNED